MNRKGQVAVYLVMVLVAITILAVMNVDLFVSVRDKFRVQNAGDAASLAAARHQGHLLNEIGRLNLEHIYAAIKEDTSKFAGIELSQRRLALLGPLEAIRLSSDAALQNGAEICEEFSEFLSDHARCVREVYASGNNDASDPYPESWPGAWEEYANELESVAREDIAAGPDNIDFVNAAATHVLMLKSFYFAIRGRDWCWFFLDGGMNSLLENYKSFHDWAPLQRKALYTFANCEIYPLYVEFRRCSLLDYYSVKEITEMMKDADFNVTEKEVGESSALRDPRACWAFLDQAKWRDWPELHNFPFAGSIKPEFSYHGAAAICRVFRKGNVWSGAAKPMMELDLNRPAQMVLPGFSDVRLVPLDTVGGSDLSTADIAWIRHVREHLATYLEHGPSSSQTACPYCRDLRQWERSSFRHSGVIWLKFNSHECNRPSSYGFEHQGNGGASHGH